MDGCSPVAHISFNLSYILISFTCIHCMFSVAKHIMYNIHTTNSLYCCYVGIKTKFHMNLNQIDLTRYANIATSNYQINLLPYYNFKLKYKNQRV